MINRRQALYVLPVLGLSCAWGPTAAQSATPACDDGDAPTARSIEGPYFKPQSPERSSLLEPEMRTERLTLTGRVLSSDCKPVGRALLDFWQADPTGAYDNDGFRFRGHQFTHADGSFTLETLTPGVYIGRTRHLHVKVQAPNGPVLTTQLYFPGEPRNDRDGLFNEALLMDVADKDGAQLARFDFIIALT